MLADQTVPYMAYSVRTLGVDTIVYDYRGSGRSNGRTRLHAITLDYKEIVDFLRDDYKRIFGYGASFGGLVLLYVHNRESLLDYILLDWVPDRITTLECPPQYDPIANVPDNSSAITLIKWSRYRVVKTRELLFNLKQRGADVIEVEAFDHPFQDSSEITTQRWQVIRSIFEKRLIGEP